MIQKSVICAKLAQLRERREVLEQLSREPREGFVSDPIKVGVGENRSDLDEFGRAIARFVSQQDAAKE
jgi:hypothetical protein